MSQLIKARFVFPIRLSLPEGGWAYKHDGDLTMIGVRSGAGELRLVLLPESERSRNKERFWLRTVFRRHPLVIARTACISPGHDLLLEEFTDAASFSQLDVCFEVSQLVDQNDKRAMAKLRDDAFARVQIFVRFYRLAANEVDVPIPNLASSPVVELAVADDYKMDEGGAEGEFHTIYRQFQWPLPATKGLLKPRMDPQRTEAFVKHLRSGKEPDLYAEQLLEAKELSRLHGNHRLAIVVAQGAFESFFQRRLLEECEARGINNLSA
ncbi:MAG: hypothetical protein V3W41_05080 [Planctomycetota bacterium]